MLKKISLLVVLLAVLGIATATQAQDGPQPVGTLFGEHDGYTLFTPQDSRMVYLVDDQGRLIHEWQVERAGRDAHLRPNGNLVVTMPLPQIEEHFASRAGFADDDGAFAEYTWDGELVWYYEFNRPNFKVHHGVEVMPNGNIMFLAWEYITPEEALANGRNPELLGDGLWPDSVFEYDPNQDAIVWEWHMWDHLIQDFDPDAANFGDVAANPQLIDVNFFEEPQWIEDWMHTNNVDYNPDLGQIALSVREFNEVWIIKHNITTEEAAGPAGDILYRWGNPRSYRMGDESTHWLGYQHDVQWIPEGYPGAGNIIMYSNIHTVDPDSTDDDNFYSRVIEFTPPLQDDGTYFREDGQAFGPADPTWIYDGLPDNQFYSQRISGVDRLPNGNTLINPGQAERLFEVTPDGEIAWEYRWPIHQLYLVENNDGNQMNVFRIERYQPDYPAFDGRDMTPGPTLQELASTSFERAAYIRLDDEGSLSAELTEDVPARYYVLILNYAQDATIAVTTEADTELSLQLLNLDGELIDEVTGMGEANLSRRFFFDGNTGGGDLIVRVSADSTDVGYQMDYSTTGDPFFGIDSAVPRIAYGQPIAGTIDFNTLSNTYTVFASSDAPLTFRVERQNGDLAPALEILTQDDEVVAIVGDEDNDGVVVLTDFIAPSDTSYIVRVVRYFGEGISTTSSGDFTLTIERP